MTSDDLSYFRARAVEERKRASASSSPAVRAAHLEFATQYEQIASRLSAAEDLRMSRDIISESLRLLKATNPLV